MVVVDSASTSREVCLHIAHKQGLSDHLGFSLQVAVYDKVLARGPIHRPPPSHMQSSTSPCIMATWAPLTFPAAKHRCEHKLPLTDMPPNQAACPLAQHSHTQPSISHTHLEGSLLGLHPAPSPPTLGSSESHASMWRSHQHCPTLNPTSSPHPDALMPCLEPGIPMPVNQGILTQSHRLEPPVRGPGRGRVQGCLGVNNRPCPMGRSLTGSCTFDAHTSTWVWQRQLSLGS